MPHTLDEVRQIALELPEEDRRELAYSLSESFAPETEIDEAWKIEAERRIDALDSGAVQAVSWEAVQIELAAMRSQLTPRS